MKRRKFLKGFLCVSTGLAVGIPAAKAVKFVGEPETGYRERLPSFATLKTEGEVISDYSWRENYTSITVQGSHESVHRSVLNEDRESRLLKEALDIESKTL
jgi:hypothetical protein